MFVKTLNICKITYYSLVLYELNIFNLNYVETSDNFVSKTFINVTQNTYLHLKKTRLVMLKKHEIIQVKYYIKEDKTFKNIIILLSEQRWKKYVNIQEVKDKRSSKRRTLKEVIA